jgi:pilus assembly protein CpaB
MKAQADPIGSKVIRKIRIKAILFLGLAFAAGLGAIYMVRWYLAKMEGAMASTPVPTTPVVTAATDIPIGTPLAAQHLAVVQWPAASVPTGAFSGIQKVMDRTVTQAVVKGEAILPERLADQSAGRGLAAVLAKGTRAMAVRVDQVIGIAGFVHPGDYVDVITTMAPDEETRKDLKQEGAKISKIILQNIKVLAVGEQMSTSGNKPTPQVQVVTLEVNPDQSERLALASRYGEIQLTMRSRVDQQTVPTAGITPIALLAPDEDAATKKEVKAPVALAAYKRRPKKAAPKAEEKPEQPVVEILRGDRIEERKLRPTADSKKQ